MPVPNRTHWCAHITNTKGQRISTFVSTAIHVCIQIIIKMYNCEWFFLNKPYYYCSTNIILHFMYIILTQTRKNRHYLYHNICMFTVTYFTGICFTEILMSAPWRWQGQVRQGRGGGNEIYMSNIQDCMHKLQNSAFVGVTLVIYVAQLVFNLSILLSDSGQLHATATLPLGKNPLLPTKQKPRWGPIWTIWRR